MSPSRKLKITRNLAINGTLLFGTLIVLEFGLFVVARFSPGLAALPALPTDLPGSQRAAPAVSPKIPDNQLGHRPRPGAPGHDDRGYRNPAALETAEIVCLGDSQTYGTGVALDEAWPQRLRELTSVEVYSIAYGGWGVTESEILLDEALSLRPKLVIEAFYSGNDLWDAFDAIYLRGQNPHHRSPDPATLALVEAVEAAAPLKSKISELYQSYLGQFETDKMTTASIREQPGTLKDALNLMRDTRHFLYRNSRLYGLLHAIWHSWSRATAADPSSDEQSWEKIRARAAVSGGFWEPWEEGGLRTVFVPKYRLAGLDLTDIRIREGHRVALAALTAISERLDGAEIEFMVLLVPTKHLVFAPFVESPSAAFVELIRNEESMWTETKHVLDAADINYIDALPALRGVLRSNEQPYPSSQDGHPNSRGHDAIAETIADWLADHPIDSGF